tara:strand:- start:1815 stop:2105 length:291 start_codon:yes stop_codon:yes gene_type:complete
MEDNNKEITEVSLFEKKYATKDLTPRVLQTFITIKEMEADAKRSNYIAVKDASAVEYQKIQLRDMIAEDEIQPMEAEQEAEVVETPTEDGAGDGEE